MYYIHAHTTYGHAHRELWLCVCHGLYLAVHMIIFFFFYEIQKKTQKTNKNQQGLTVIKIK